MNKSRPHGFIAGLSDFYLAAVLLGAVLALGVALARKPAPLFLQGIILLASIAGVILYHTKLSKRTFWLSPGEQLAGRILWNGVKEWVNPYGRNRWALFTVILVTLILAGNAWDWVSDRVEPLSRVIGYSVRLFLVCWGLVLMGKGRAWGAVFPVVIFSIAAIFTPHWRSEEARLTMTALFGFIAVTNGLVALAYHFLKSPRPVS